MNAVSHQRRAEPLDFVGVGLVALGSVMTLAGPFSAGNDWKADATTLWEPELGTFVSLSADVLTRWGWSTGLLSSLADDADGTRLRQLLVERGIELIYGRHTARTGRQMVLTPAGTEIRYGIDHHIERPPLDSAARAALGDVAGRMLERGVRWIAYDKYERDLVATLVESPAWRERRLDQRPGLLFETGSRPLCLTQAGSMSATAAADLELIDRTDVFTTTWEWLCALVAGDPQAAAALDGASLGRPDDAHPPDGALARLLGDLVLRPDTHLPTIAIISGGSAGCWIATRDGRSGVVLRHQQTAGDHAGVARATQSRVGAGDVLRATLLAVLLDEKISPAALPAFVAEHGERWVSTAQLGARRWLVREPEATNYFGGFPCSLAMLCRNA